MYWLSKKSWPISYSKLLYNLGQDFLDIQYTLLKSALDTKHCVRENKYLTPNYNELRLYGKKEREQKEAKKRDREKK